MSDDPPEEALKVPLLEPGPFPSESARLLAEAHAWLNDRPAISVAVNQMFYETYADQPPPTDLFEDTPWTPPEDLPAPIPEARKSEESVTA